MQRACLGKAQKLCVESLCDSKLRYFGSGSGREDEQKDGLMDAHNTLDTQHNMLCTKIICLSLVFAALSLAKA